MFTPKIGLIVCSTRKPRACPQIAQFVVDAVQSTATQQSNATPIPQLIDLAEWNLPMYDESDIPSQITDSSQYDHQHTREWSQEIKQYDAFIFVVPQYNWSYPAVIKNAIDYLYHEWNGKPAFVVSYGGHGGGKCNRHLREVLQGVRMKTISNNVELAFPGRDILVKAARGKDIGLQDDADIWKEERGQILNAFEELLKEIPHVA
ncbi:hypothetical protein N7462_004783 [Penicillium macrosclerotiorum]|uniref:uncharacterized protein n=1 Tax=Penicillium macrosclerotiorum TaxID=303699 RepID=UPI0025476B1E|nr:uncharacterized protein N7462_004783 [Penicillium macrosclerotiorum]KAJ5690391.1 hypothetical protein N7462_004783 [Penicillium macrosclerotiorum]